MIFLCVLLAWNKKQCLFLVSGGPFCVCWIFLSMNNRRRHRGELYQHQEVQRTTRSRSRKPPHHGTWSSLPLIFLRPCTRSYFVISFKHYLISFKRVVSCWILSWQPLFWCYCSSWRVIFVVFWAKKRYLSVGVVTCWSWFFFPIRGFASLFHTL